MALVHDESTSNPVKAEKVAIDVTGDDTKNDLATAHTAFNQDKANPPTSQRRASVPKEKFRLEFTNVSYSVLVKAKKGEPESDKIKTIIHPISGAVEPGRMLALMGSSGAGKSTMLDLLAARIVGPRLKGTVTLNGKTFPPGQYRKLTTYCMQEDALFPMLTVRETFRFAARLRVGDHKGAAFIEQLVTETIDLLGLTKAADTIVGDELNRGLSGGEKRRVSIGCEIINSPAVLFLDEPTSGLDSTTALQIVETIQNLCRQGRTVVMTVHQPSMRVFQCFDDVIFLNHGKVVYYGPTDGVVPYAESKGKTVAPFSNVPELFLEMVGEFEQTGRLNELHVDTTENGSNQVTKVDSAGTFSKGSGDSDYANSFVTETVILIKRNLLNTLRTKELFFARMTLSILMGIVLGTLFFDAPANVDGSRERTSYAAFGAAFFIFTSLEALPIFIAARAVFTRESSRGAFRSMSYALAAGITVIPFLFILSLIFVSISYFMVGLSDDVSDYFLFVLIMLLTCLVGDSTAVMISAVVDDPLMANTLGTSWFAFQFLFSGFFITKDNIPDGWIWMHYISAFKYSSESLMIIALDENIPTDQATLQSFGVEDVSVWRGVGVLAFFWLFYRLLFYILLVVRHSGSRK